MAAKAMKREAVTSAAPTAKRAKAEDVDEATEVERELVSGTTSRLARRFLGMVVTGLRTGRRVC